MINYCLQQAAQILGLDANASKGDAGIFFTGISTDTRQIQAGQLFIAIKGPNFDGHEFLATALERGAVAALVEQPQSVPIVQLQVTDTVKALGQLAAAWRSRWQRPVLALTGSNGKTTVKEMLASILRQRGEVFATVGNLNNHIGLPLMLAQLGEQYDHAVLEMGANHLNEIAYLTHLAKPDVALINNAGPAHLEGFGDLDGVARGKGEIYQGLGAQGIALINLDDVYAEYWQSLNTQRQTITFGFAEKAQIRGEELVDGRLRIHLQQETVDVALPLPGAHNQRNALAAAAAAWAVRTDGSSIQQGLETVQAVQGRMQSLTGLYGCTIINDTYNANPASLMAGLRALPANSERWLVLGDMAELGATTAAIHAQVGRDVHTAGISRLFTVGQLSQATSHAFGAGSAHFTTFNALIEALQAELAQGSAPIILIKGSRSMRMERVVEALAAREHAAC